MLRRDQAYDKISVTGEIIEVARMKINAMGLQ
jgi:hypothetical protein